MKDMTAHKKSNNTKNSEDKKTKSGDLSELIRSLLIAVILAVLFRSVLYEPFHIPSGSMRGTLLEGDYIFVSKFSYGYSRYSFPFGLPIFEDRIFETKPERGDVVVFRKPHNEDINYIKRLIGLPGDKIQMIDGHLQINGSAIPKVRTDDFAFTSSDGSKVYVPQFIETLPNGISYKVLDQDPNYIADNTGIYVVPEGHYFFMGDNRDNSVDSRFTDEVGYVPEVNLVGRAEIILFSSSASLFKVWQWFTGFKTDRFIKKIALSNEG